MTIETWFDKRKRSLKRWLCKALDSDKKGYVNLTDLIAGIASLIILGAISFIIGFIVVAVVIGAPFMFGTGIFEILGFELPATAGFKDELLYWILGLGGLTGFWHGTGAVVRSLSEINKRTPDVKMPRREFVILRCDREPVNEWTKTEEVLDNSEELTELLEESGN